MCLKVDEILILQKLKEVVFNQKSSWVGVVTKSAAPDGRDGKCMF
jgi:hypothetical protein